MTIKSYPTGEDANGIFDIPVSQPGRILNQDGITPAGIFRDLS